MKIRFDHVISVAVLVVFAVISANAKNVPQIPGAINNQSSPAKPSARMSSNKIIFPVSHIEALEKSTTVTTSKPTLITSAASTTTVLPTSIMIVETTTTKLPEPANHTTSTASIKGMAETQTVKIANVGTANENRTDGEVYTLGIKYLVNPPVLQDPPIENQCPTGYTLMPNGDCKPKFVDN